MKEGGTGMNEDAGLRYGLPSRYYLMPEVFEAEKERIFYRSWQFACHLETVRKPGDYATCSVADQDLMVIRDRAGQLRAFYNVCRHRAHQLLEGSGRLHARWALARIEVAKRGLAL